MENSKMINKSFINKIKKLKGPYIIAEIGVNHHCSIKLAKQMIIDAKKGGAQAVKFQAYKAETIASKESPAYWDIKKEKTRNQYSLFKKYDCFGKKEFIILHNFCKKKKIDFLCTPFSLEFVDILDPLVPAFKVSSSDLTNKPLIEKICKTKKTIILSTGAATFDEIKETISWIKKYNNELILLHCVLNYPTKNEDANLGAILDLSKKFPKYIIGYSDHTMPDKEMKNLNLAWLLGAKVIEKHFTFNKKRKGNDHYHAMDKKDLIKFTNIVNENLKLIGKGKIGYSTSEKISRKNARRAIYSNINLYKGKIIKKKDLICKRPFNNGISPKHLNFLIGKKIKKDLKKDQKLTWKNF
jgi:sialic acid synthase SpsE